MAFRIFTSCLLFVMTLITPQVVLAASTSNFTIEIGTLPVAPVSSGGAGGGGAVSTTEQIEENTIVTVNGIAYPFAPVVWLKDGQIVDTTTADAAANFSMRVNNLAEGFHNFSLYAEDPNGFRSTLYTFSIDVVPGATINVTNVVTAPTISLTKQQVAQGDVFGVSGYTIPNGEVVILAGENTHFVNSDALGLFNYTVESAQYEKATYIVYARTNGPGYTTPDSDHMAMVVGDESVDSIDRTSVQGDLDKDGSVNLVDFSIAVFWFGKVLVGEVPPFDLDFNDDGVVNLADFSIMAFNWTG